MLGGIGFNRDRDATTEGARDRSSAVRSREKESRDTDVVDVESLDYREVEEEARARHESEMRRLRQRHLTEIQEATEQVIRSRFIDLYCNLKIQ